MSAEESKVQEIFGLGQSEGSGLPVDGAGSSMDAAGPHTSGGGASEAGTQLGTAPAGSPADGAAGGHAVHASGDAAGGQGMHAAGSDGSSMHAVGEGGGHATSAADGAGGASSGGHATSAADGAGGASSGGHATSAADGAGGASSSSAGGGATDAASSHGAGGSASNGAQAQSAGGGAQAQSAGGGAQAPSAGGGAQAQSAGGGASNGASAQSAGGASNAASSPGVGGGGSNAATAQSSVGGGSHGAPGGGASGVSASQGAPGASSAASHGAVSGAPGGASQGAVGSASSASTATSSAGGSGMAATGGSSMQPSAAAAGGVSVGQATSGGGTSGAPAGSEGLSATGPSNGGGANSMSVADGAGSTGQAGSGPLGSSPGQGSSGLSPSGGTGNTQGSATPGGSSLSDGSSSGSAQAPGGGSSLQSNGASPGGSSPGGSAPGGSAPGGSSAGGLQPSDAVGGAGSASNGLPSGGAENAAGGLQNGAGNAAGGLQNGAGGGSGSGLQNGAGGGGSPLQAGGAGQAPGGSSGSLPGGVGQGGVPPAANTVSGAAEASTKKKLFDELITRFPPKDVAEIVATGDTQKLRQLLVNQLPEGMRPDLINDVLDMAGDHLAKKKQQAEDALKALESNNEAAAAALKDLIKNDNLKITIASGDKLDVREFNVREKLSSLFDVRLFAVSRNADVKFDDVVGKAASFELRTDRLDESKNRFWHGVCSRIEQVGVDVQGLSAYELTIVPTLWKLSQRKNYRVYQYLSEPETVKQLLTEWNIVQEWRIDWGQYKARKYRVQYDESDLAFVNRTLEDAGITYFFEQVEGETIMVLEEAPHLAKPREPSIDYENRGMQQRNKEFVTDLQIGSRVRPGRYTIFDHDYRKAADFTLAATASGGLAEEAQMERFQYLPGAFLFVGGGGDSPVADDRGSARHDQGEADKLAKKRFEAKRSAADFLTFETNVHQLRPGMVMEISNHPRSDLTGVPLLVMAARIEGTATGEWRHSCEVRNAKLPFRPALITPKPKVQGPESATVVGPPGEEIHTDEFGRVRIQFHWDREGARDHNASCWVHVSQPWSGTGFGGVNIPRVGQEVIVEFLSGDPDRPIVMGRYFTNTGKVPYKLPENKTQSGWKSMSSPGGGGYNELMFEDKKGKELVRFQAEKDFTGLVKNDYAMNIQHNRTHHVQNDDRETVGRDQTVQVGSDRLVSVGRDQSHQVKGNILVHAMTGELRQQAHGMILMQSLAPSAILLKCGGSSITMTDQQIVIEAAMVHINPGEPPPPAPDPQVQSDQGMPPSDFFFGAP